MYYILAPLTMHVFVYKTGKIIWSGRNQEGAGTTAGEEVEMVNSYLSRCGLTTKYMTKSGKLCLYFYIYIFINLVLT